MPRGGARIGAGRPRKERPADWLAGHPGKRGPRPVERPSESPVGPQGAVSRPNWLEDDGKGIWDELAPLALAQHTLTPTTAQAFADLCAYIALERRMRAAPLAVGGADHRGMMARVEAGRARFRLTPDGKPVIVEQVKDEWAEFDGPQLVQSA